ncbi:family 43 glycosylhydrolase [Sphingomonas sp. M1-B02]|uniref:family 43 glycosylhydrolase n=1 Tax=Sphingomonas sp. M1-B02 TaxID=3114300 RepID=UPI0022401578|nr:family 43 glycosylhydrolase [Sphingomonas sp. S6-11]UZK67924.1 family 43 glycosylhydrolase [Sphingomonas sp. S6-11]
MRIVGFATLLAIVPLAGSAQDANSVFAGADPDLEYAENRYWVYPTGGGGLWAWSSTDKVHWVRQDLLLDLQNIRWAADDGAARHHLWAPDMVRANGRWYFYFSIGPQNPTPSRLGVATCKGPSGPCADSGKPLFTGGNGFEAIDPAVFIDPKSRIPYLYAGGSAGAKLRVWVLKPDMVTIEREVSVVQPRNFTEGAFMHERRGVYYLSYSAGRWNDASYQVHYSTAPSPTGPWRYRGTILQSDRTHKGPGHHSFLRDPAGGNWLIAYHRWEGQSGEGPYKGSRRVVIDKIGYRRDGSILPIRMK